MKKGVTLEEILTFGPQGDVTPGPNFSGRYADGGIRLVPGKNGLFTLVISKVTSSDEGNYECNGTEWTHEKGGKWIKIVESTKEMGTVSVTPTGKKIGPYYHETFFLLLMQSSALFVILPVFGLSRLHKKLRFAHSFSCSYSKWRDSGQQFYWMSFHDLAFLKSYCCCCSQFRLFIIKHLHHILCMVLRRWSHVWNTCHGPQESD